MLASDPLYSEPPPCTGRFAFVIDNAFAPKSVLRKRQGAAHENTAPRRSCGVLRGGFLRDVIARRVLGVSPAKLGFPSSQSRGAAGISACQPGDHAGTECLRYGHHVMPPIRSGITASKLHPDPFRAQAPAKVGSVSV